MFIIFDAAIFLCLFFTATRAVLFLDEGIYSAAAAALHIGVSALILLVVSIIFLRYVKRISTRGMLGTLIIEQAILILILILLYSFAHMRPTKGMDNLWFALQWSLLPLNFRLMSAVAPSFTALEAAAFFLLAWLGVAKGKRLFAAAPLIALALIIAWQTFDIPSPQKHIHYLLFFAVPPVLAAVFLCLKRPRLFGRFLILSAAGLMVFWYYTGFLPLSKGPTSLPSSVKVFYPLAGRKPDFPLMYMRNFTLDKAADNLFTTFGPTSGIVKIHLPDARAQVIHTRGLARSLALDEPRSLILVLDWDFADLLFYSIEPLRLWKKVSIFERGSVIMPWAVALHKGKIYANICGFPGLAVYDRETLRRLQWLPYKGRRMTSFNYGAEEMVLDPENDRLFVHLGPIDTKNRFRLARISLSPSARVERHAAIPEGGMGLLLVNEKNSVFVTAFYSRRLYEFDAGTLEVKRVLDGVLNSRNVVYDPARNVLFTTGFLSGTLAAIDYDTGKIIRKIRIGKRSNALLMDVKNDVLYVGCSWGILKVKPAEFIEGN